MINLSDVRIETARQSDLERLVKLRLIAMKPSLEQIGRFNPERARARFEGEFQPEHTRLVLHKDDLIGCYAVIPKVNKLYLAHLYLLPKAQDMGLGKQLMLRVLAVCKEARKDMFLIVLDQSPALNFYEKHGFSVLSKDGVDITMELKFRD